MQVYFGFTVAGDRLSVSTARFVVRLLENLGHNVLTRHLVDDNAWESDRASSPLEVFRRDMRWLQQRDVFIAEVSGSSFGLGFEAGFLLGATQKSVILPFRHDLRDKISLLITGNVHADCEFLPYPSEAELNSFLRIRIGCSGPESCPAH